MAEHESPDWQHLPHHPERFFGLAKGYDRKALKRSYNKLLRQFKPDKFPAEFERLRAAFEQLNHQFESGANEPSVPLVSPLSGEFASDLASFESALSRPASHRWQSHSPLSTPETRGTETEFETLAQNLQAAAVKDVYEQLVQKPSKTPYEFFALAILSDELHAPQEMVFCRWLVAGLETHRGDAGLLELLQVYLSSDEVPVEKLPEVLVEVAHVVPNDWFYYLSGPAFDRLLREGSWEEFARCLRACEQHVRDHQVHWRVLFMCRLLRRIVWVAPLEVAQDLIDEVEQHSDLLWRTLEQEFELVYQLMEYMRQRENLLAQGPVSQRIDRAMRAFCLGQGSEADQAVIACQNYLAQHPRELFSELGLQRDQGASPLLAWIWISEEVEQHLATPAVQMEPEEMLHPTFRLLQHIESQTPLVKFQVLSVARLAVMTVTVLLAGFLPLILGVLVSRWLPGGVGWPISVISFLICLTTLISFYVGPPKRLLDRWCFLGGEWIVRGLYLRLWRSLIRRFFAATHLRYGDFCRGVSVVVQTQHKLLNVSTWLPNFCAQDIGMLIYATAVRFLR